MANGYVSDIQQIVCGVPQGSILGPLLFLAYINDIGSGIEGCDVRLYADDTVIYAGAPEIEEAQIKLATDLAKIDIWCTENQLTINKSKTKCMLFGRKKFINANPLPIIKIDNEQIQYVDSYKYLGVTLDQGLNFNIHTQNIYKLSSHKVYMLSRIHPYITKDAALKIYKSKICPYMDYGDILYTRTFAPILDKLQKLQFRAIRICLNVLTRTSRQELTYRAQLPLLENRHITHL